MRTHRMRRLWAWTVALALLGCSQHGPGGATHASATTDAGRSGQLTGASTGVDVGTAGTTTGTSTTGTTGSGDTGGEPTTGSGDTGGEPKDAGATGRRDGAPSDPGHDAATSADGGSARGVELGDDRLRVDGAPFQIQGVCWNPVGQGGVHPGDLDFAGFVEQDAQLMQAAGINAVRTYETLTDLAVLDTLYAAGIRVLNMVYAWGGADPSEVDAKVQAVKEHPAILMWVLGNEWNYNGLYVGLSHAQSLERLNQVAARILAIDDTHPIATVYGEIPSKDTVDAMPLIDVWGINAYRGLSFGTLFDDLAAVTHKPMFLAEYGADAYDARQGAVNPAAQAEATRALTEEILAHAAGASPDGRCLGGTLFEWADEWWKDGAGRPDVQDVGGIAPGGGPHPDQTFNEEWWGVVDIDRHPRPAYDALKALYAPP